MVAILPFFISDSRKIFLLLLVWCLSPLSMPAKLYFRHGVVSSAKTLQLLAVSHTYQQQGNCSLFNDNDISFSCINLLTQSIISSHFPLQQGKQILLLKPAIDTRFGKLIIQSRAGLSATADIVISPDSHTLFADIVKQSEAKNIQVRFLSLFLHLI